jgi:hypothetical protein
MTWALEADVDFKGESTVLVKPFVDFYDKDINKARFHVQRGDYYPFEEIADFQLEASASLATMLLENIKKYEADDIRITIDFYLEVIEPRYFPVPNLMIFGSNLGSNCVRRRSPVVIGFGNRNAWRGDTTLPHSGRKVDESLVALFLKYFCLEVRPESLYLVNEQQASIPFNDHFVYHSDISGFANDLYDIMKLCLYGGKGIYSDGRQLYKAALYEEKTMLLCNRSGEYREKFKQYLLAKLPMLENKGLLNLSRDLAETAFLKYSDVLDYFTDESSGIGIFSKPLLDKYVEMFYISMIDDLTNENKTTQKEYIS